MSHQVALSFEDGVTRVISCAEDQTVADASYRQRINIPLDCRDGACGTCKAFCESGTYDGGSYIDDALSGAEAETGYVLPCSMTPKSDLVLRIASTSAVAKTEAASYTGTVSTLERLSATTMALGIQLHQPEDLVFLPGQYVNIAVPGTEEARSYSFSNSPEDKELTFLIKLTPGGMMSDYLTERAALDDELTITGPNGSFFLRETDRPALLLAGGTGLAPILSVLRTLRAHGSTRPVHLVYGASTDDDVVELETLETIDSQLPNLTWEYCVADQDSSAPNKGYVMSLIRDEHLHGGDVAVYTCGPPPMVDAVREHFTERDVEPTGFYYEKFALAAPATPSAEATAEPTAADEPASVPEQATGAEPEPPVAATVGQPAVSAAAPAADLSAATSISATASATPDQERPASPAGEGRAVVGQEMLPAASVTPLRPETPATAEDEAAIARTLAGQAIWPAGSGNGRAVLDDGEPLRQAEAARSLAGQEMLPEREDIEPLVAPAAAPAPAEVVSDGYQIGEEHPSVHESDAIFEARQALELGAVEITIGRLDSQQLAGYRLLAESTVPKVDGDRFVDAAAYTETNAAFHDYLFTLTGNTHLLEAYRALGVKGHMDEVLRDATWCHPSCTQDHLDIVTAFEEGDRQQARRLISEHAEHAKLTTRRAMDDSKAAKRPKFISPGRFAGKIVLVTGAAQGIGEHTARRISAEGGTVVLADRSELVTELADELARGEQEALAVTADLESWEGAQRAAEAAMARFGRIDVLINNVGGAIWFKPFTEFAPGEISAEINRSLMTTLWCCRAALPAMVERQRGVVVNISSAATRGIHRIPYSAAKGGINAITASLAFEYADAGIRVVATAPGGTAAPPRRVSRGGSGLETEQQQAWHQAHIDQTVDSSLLKRYGTLEEQAAAITFLASDEASYVTGTTLPVAGGDLG